MSDPFRRRLGAVCVALAVGLTACGSEAGDGPPVDEIATTAADASIDPGEETSTTAVGPGSKAASPETEATTTTVESDTPENGDSTVGHIQMASGDILEIGPIGDIVPGADLSDATVVRCPPGRDSEGSLTVMVRTDSIVFLASINEITFSHHSVMVYEEGVGRFESEATSSLNRSQWFDVDGNELPGPLLSVENGRISGTATLDVGGFDETRELEFDLPLPDEIADSVACAR